MKRFRSVNRAIKRGHLKVDLNPLVVSTYQPSLVTGKMNKVDTIESQPVLMRRTNRGSWIKY